MTKQINEIPKVNKEENVQDLSLNNDLVDNSRLFNNFKQLLKVSSKQLKYKMYLILSKEFGTYKV